MEEAVQANPVLWDILQGSLQGIIDLIFCCVHTAGMCVTRLIMTGRTGLAVATASTPFQKQTCHLTVKCESGDSGVSSLDGAGHLQPTELLMPLSQLVEAKVLYCAVPAMGHNQVCVQIFHDFSSDLDIGI